MLAIASNSWFTGGMH